MPTFSHRFQALLGRCEHFRFSPGLQLHLHEMLNRTLMHPLPCLILFVFFFFFDVVSFAHDEKILLSRIPSLTFHKDKFTRPGRTPAIPQINCIGGDACQHEIDTILCTNLGWDGSTFQWKCTADLDEGLRFGETTVTCEGYLYPDDPYVLEGSCGVEYQLFYTHPHPSQNEDQFFQPPWNVKNEARHYDDIKSRPRKGTFISKLATSLWFLGLLFVIYRIIRSCMNPAAAREARRRDGDDGPGFDGGPGFGGDGDEYYGSAGPPSNPSSNRNFWAGIGLGTLGTYLATRRSQRSSVRRPESRNPTASFSSFGSPSSSTTSTTIRTATGFGGTRRR